MHVLGRPVDDERLYDLKEVEGDREEVDTQVVNVNVEAVALVRAEAVGRRVVEELVRVAVLVQVDREYVHRRQHLQRRVHHVRPVIESFHQVVDGLDRLIVETILVIEQVRVVVDPFAEPAHQCLILCHVQKDHLVLFLVLVVVVPVLFRRLLVHDILGDRLHERTCVRQIKENGNNVDGD